MHRRFAVALAVLSASGLHAQSMMAPEQVPQILVSGTGQTTVIPDRAAISISVQTRALTAAKAASANAQRQRAVFDTLRALGIPATQLSTQDYNIIPEQRYDSEGHVIQITGYTVMNTLRVDVSKMDMIGSIIDASLAKGANVISSLEFLMADPDQGRRLALAAATQAARGDAEAIAKAAGGTLGDLIQISSTMEGPPRPVFMAMAKSADSGTPISQGSQTVAVTVMASWKFVPGK